MRIVSVVSMSIYKLFVVGVVIMMLPLCSHSQYTDVINSNRPGASVSAYSVGRNVLQFEAGLDYINMVTEVPDAKSGQFGLDLAIRYGLLFEPLEVVYEGTYVTNTYTLNELGHEIKNNDFTKNRIGIKYLVYDRFKNPENNKPNLLSWRANNVFQLKNLIPSVSVYGGANYIFDDNYFYPVELFGFSPRAGVNTQSRLTPRSVLITNIVYDHIGTDYTQWEWVVTYTRAFRNPKWSAFLEYQGYSGELLRDHFFRFGSAYLFNESIQFDAQLSTNFEENRQIYSGSIGVSYRIDNHVDRPIAIEDQDAEGNGPIQKNSMKKKKGKKKKKKGKDNGAIDF